VQLTARQSARPVVSSSSMTGTFKCRRGVLGDVDGPLLDLGTVDIHILQACGSNKVRKLTP